MKNYNVLWLMSDQHNANCIGYMNHPNIKTPNLDRISQRGISFRNCFVNNPICSPSRICFMTGQYLKNHRLFGNYHAELEDVNPFILPRIFKDKGYETALIGKSHTLRAWDESAYSHIRYTDLCDAKRNNPKTTHYFNELCEKGLGDTYEEGDLMEGMAYCIDGSAPSVHKYEDTIEYYTGENAVKYLDNRDESRPFFLKVSFQRPHNPIVPTKEYFDLYDPDKIELPNNAVDFLENNFEGKPSHQLNRLMRDGIYPLADKDTKRLKRAMASYYGLIASIDDEIGKILDKLEESNLLEDTIIVYTSDHGDFAGEHGLMFKNLGIYDSIQRVPLILSYPNGPRNIVCDDLVESVDLFPTLCELTDIKPPSNVDGKSFIGVINHEKKGKDAVFCEWERSTEGRILAIRTRDFRMVIYEYTEEGELYDHRNDEGELYNLWNHKDYANVKMQLQSLLLKYAMSYRARTDLTFDRIKLEEDRFSPTVLLQNGKKCWSDLEKVYNKNTIWKWRDSK